MALPARWKRRSSRGAAAGASPETNAGALRDPAGSAAGAMGRGAQRHGPPSSTTGCRSGVSSGFIRAQGGEGKNVHGCCPPRRRVTGPPARRACLRGRRPARHVTEPRQRVTGTPARDELAREGGGVLDSAWEDLRLAAAARLNGRRRREFRGVEMQGGPRGDGSSPRTRQRQPWPHLAAARGVQYGSPWCAAVAESSAGAPCWLGL